MSRETSRAPPYYRFSISRGLGDISAVVAYTEFAIRCHGLGQHDTLGKFDAADADRWRRGVPYPQYSLLDHHHSLPRDGIVTVINAVAAS